MHTVCSRAAASTSASVRVDPPWLAVPISLWCDSTSGAFTARPTASASRSASSMASPSSRMCMVISPAPSRSGSATSISSCVVAARACG